MILSVFAVPFYWPPAATASPAARLPHAQRRGYHKPKHGYHKARHGYHKARHGYHKRTGAATIPV
jgi:hypothetical protein